MTFSNLLHNKKVLKSIDAMGYTEATEIQEKAIPIIFNKQDVLAKSKTGTGKTAAFGLPMIQMLLEKEIHQALVLCPTRELAIQVSDELQKFSKYADEIKVTCIYGGSPIDRQIRTLKKGVDIVVGTPGRIQDHIRRKSLRMDKIDYVVLDEADEMLNIGFRDDIEDILSKIKSEHQTVLFSATLPKAIKEIAATYLKDQVEIEVKSQTKTVTNIEQSYITLKKGDKKDEIIKLILGYKQPELVIIFCNTKARVDELVNYLHALKYHAYALHGDVRQEKRTKIMNNFKRAKQAILVASDVAARGIDVNNINLVINYDLPQDNEVYVHRIGRTGRAGNKGESVSLIQGNKQKNQLRQLMRFTKADMKETPIPTAEDMQNVGKKILVEKVEERIQKEGIIFGNVQLANQLIKKGYDAQEILSALISIANNGPILEETSPNKRKKKIDNPVQVRFTIGSAKRINVKDIIEAIDRDCKITSDALGSIDIRKQYTIVETNKKDAETIIKCMNPSYIKKTPFDVYYYKKEKEKKSKKR